jgi:hypothetical protein
LSYIMKSRLTFRAVRCPSVVASPSTYPSLACSLLRIPFISPTTTSSTFTLKPTIPLQRTFTTTTRLFNMPETAGNNNADFKLAELFNVKDKVALVTGGG